MIRYSPHGHGATHVPQKILDDALASQIAQALHSSLGQSAQPTFGVGHNRGPPLASEAQVLTVAEFCNSFRVSRSHLYELFREGLGPRVFRVGNSLRISKTAASEWVAEQEARAEAKKEQAA
jgi:excisionase family DNA binding protein